MGVIRLAPFLLFALPLVAQTAFPEIVDGESVQITLFHNGCYGACPDYQIELRGDGTVTYNGRSFVPVVGKHTLRITPDEVRALVEDFRRLNFFSIPEGRTGLRIADLPFNVIKFTSDGGSRTLQGDEVRQKSEFDELTKRIETTARVSLWLKGDRETFELLQQEGYDFSSAGAGATVSQAAFLGRRELVKLLMEAGAPLDRDRSGERPKNVGVSPDYGLDVSIINAIWGSDSEIVILLIRAGASKDDLPTIQRLRAILNEVKYTRALQALEDAGYPNSAESAEQI